MGSEDSCFIPTRGSSYGSTKIEYQTATYASHYKSGRKPEESSGSYDKVIQTSSDKNTVDQKRLKQEIIRFGMSGLAPKDGKQAKIQLAIKLGAKPPKNKYKNYKLLIEEKKKNMEKSKLEEHQFKLRTTVKQKVPGKKNKPKTNASGIVEVYGKVDKAKIKAMKMKRR